MNLLFSYIKILIFTGLIGLCMSCGSQANIDGEKIDISWLVGIFHVPRRDASENQYQYQCLGALIHEKVVLASASCVPSGMAFATRVRVYDWRKNSNTVTKDTPFEERSVSRIINFAESYPGDDGKANINMVVLSEPLSATSTAVMGLGFRNKSLRNTKKYSKLNFNPWICSFLTSEGTLSTGITVKPTQISSIFTPDCCVYNGLPVTDLGGRSQEYSIDDKCWERLSEIKCFGSMAHACQKSYKKGPLICPGPENSPMLFGLMFQTNDCVVEFAEVTKSEWWINEQINKLA